MSRLATTQSIFAIYFRLRANRSCHIPRCQCTRAAGTRTNLRSIANICECTADSLWWSTKSLWFSFGEHENRRAICIRPFFFPVICQSIHETRTNILRHSKLVVVGTRCGSSDVIADPDILGCVCVFVLLGRTANYWNANVGQSDEWRPSYFLEWSKWHSKHSGKNFVSVSFFLFFQFSWTENWN